MPEINDRKARSTNLKVSQEDWDRIFPKKKEVHFNKIDHKDIAHLPYPIMGPDFKVEKIINPESSQTSN